MIINTEVLKQVQDSQGGWPLSRLVSKKKLAQRNLRLYGVYKYISITVIVGVAEECRTDRWSSAIARSNDSTNDTDER